MKKIIMLTAAAGVLLVPALAIAQRDDHGSKPPATRVELQKHIAEHFALIDTNKDGTVSKAEFDAHRDAMKKQWAEKRAKWQSERFAAMDGDKNGQVSKAEYDAYNASRAERRGERRHNGQGMDDGRRHGGRVAHDMMMMRGMDGDMFARLDANKDGKMTQAEFSAKLLDMFDRADTNKDGTVTPEERKAAWERMRGEWRDKAGKTDK